MLTVLSISAAIADGAGLGAEAGVTDARFAPVRCGVPRETAGAPVAVAPFRKRSAQPSCSARMRRTARGPRISQAPVRCVCQTPRVSSSGTALYQADDCGSKIGFLAANVAYGLERADIAPDLRTEMRRLLDGR